MLLHGIRAERGKYDVMLALGPDGILIGCCELRPRNQYQAAATAGSRET